MGLAVGAGNRCCGRPRRHAVRISKSVSLRRLTWHIGGVSSDQLRILCVDDDPLFLKGIVRQIRRQYEVIGVTSGAAGLEALSEGEEIAVVISDLRMPEMDGIQFLKSAMALSPNSVRILVTGYKDTIDLATYLDSRLLFRVIEKPCTSDILFAAIDNAVELYR
jgi:DNA-binding NtrC family response regulator